ncbi:MAG: hypothetical protein ACR5KX_06345 [Wolbachia sp.]
MPQAEKTKSGKERNIVQEENIQDKQIVSIMGSFGCNVTNSRKQVTRAPVVVAAMYDNFAWFRSFRLLNFFSTVQFFFQQPPRLS